MSEGTGVFLAAGPALMTVPVPFILNALGLPVLT